MTWEVVSPVDLFCFLNLGQSGPLARLVLTSLLQKCPSLKTPFLCTPEFPAVPLSVFTSQPNVSFQTCLSPSLSPASPLYNVPIALSTVLNHLVYPILIFVILIL